MGKIALLLVNLGSPDSPTLKAVHRYLVEFLTDPRVIDLPWLKRQILVRGLIIPKRLKSTTDSYKAIWKEGGSPLICYSESLRNKLQGALGEHFIVQLAMRYQNPSIDTALHLLSKQRPEKLVILPLFPQYASATTGSIFAKITNELSHWQTVPEVCFISHFANDPHFIGAFAKQAKGYNLHSYDKILFSYHGLPIRQIMKADEEGKCLKTGCCHAPDRNCYAAQCFATTKALAEHLTIPPEKYKVIFQSRLGKEAWLTPYASETLAELAKQGHKRLLVFSPAFVADCLETIYEIGVEYQHLFQSYGGEVLDLIPSLNDTDPWVDALAKMVHKRLSI